MEEEYGYNAPIPKPPPDAKSHFINIVVCCMLHGEKKMAGDNDKIEYV